MSVAEAKIDPVAKNATLRPAPRDTGNSYSIRFNNLREIWQGQRAARKLNMSFNSYVRALILAHSEKILNGKRKGR